MPLTVLIVYISLLVWLLPPLRQLNKGYFLYFLILGYSDPVALFLFTHKLLGVSYLHLLTSFLLASAVLYYNKNLNYKWMVSFLLIYVIIILFFNYNFVRYSIALIHLFIVILMTIAVTKDFYLNKGIKLYLSVILLYEVTIVLKFAALIMYNQIGVYYFYSTLVFELLFGLFFVFCNQKNSPIIRLPYINREEV